MKYLSILLAFIFVVNDYTAKSNENYAGILLPQGTKVIIDSVNIVKYAGKGVNSYQVENSNSYNSQNLSDGLFPTLPSKLHVYPNPSDGIVNIDFAQTQSGAIRIVVSDLSSRQVAVFNGSTHAGTQSFRFCAGATGMYIVSVVCPGNKMSTKVLCVSNGSNTNSIVYLGSTSQSINNEENSESDYKYIGYFNGMADTVNVRSANTNNIVFHFTQIKAIQKSSANNTNTSNKQLYARVYDANSISLNSGNSNYTSLSGDFNGDGKTDITTISAIGGGRWNDSVALDLSKGNGFTSTVWKASTPASMRNGGSSNKYISMTGDFNGDGKTDIATISANGGGGWNQWIAMELSTGNGFTSTTWNASTPIKMRNGGGSDYVFITGDFNGDGKTDIATVSKSGRGGWMNWYAVELSNGNGFTSTVWYSATPNYMRCGGGIPTDYKVLAGDFNGDGKTDIATISATAKHAWNSWYAIDLSNGNGFTSTIWNSPTPMHMRNGGGKTSDYKIIADDFDGDGKTDIATVSATAGGGWHDWFAMDLSNGNGFTSSVWNATTPIHMRNGGGNTGDFNIISGDFNNDGKADIATVSAISGGDWSKWYAIELSKGNEFTSTVWNATTPTNMRNGGGKTGDYNFISGDFNGDGKTDIATISATAAGGWNSWYAIDLSKGNGFTSTVWNTSTPTHMRNSGVTNIGENGATSATGASFVLYRSEYEAMEAAVGNVWNNSINEGIEYGGVIYKLNGAEKWGYVTIKGSQHEITTNGYYPSASEVTAYWHTHPNRASVGPSPADLLNMRPQLDMKRLYTVVFNPNNRNTPKITSIGPLSDASGRRTGNKWWDTKSPADFISAAAAGATVCVLNPYNNNTYAVTLSDLQCSEFVKGTVGLVSLKYANNGNVVTFYVGPVGVSTSGNVSFTVGGTAFHGSISGSGQLNVPALLNGNWREVLGAVGSLGIGGGAEVLGVGLAGNGGEQCTITFKEEGPGNNWGSIVPY